MSVLETNLTMVRFFSLTKVERIYPKKKKKKSNHSLNLDEINILVKLIVNSYSLYMYIIHAC